MLALSILTPTVLFMLWVIWNGKRLDKKYSNEVYDWSSTSTEPDFNNDWDIDNDMPEDIEDVYPPFNLDDENYENREH
jgi:hypothetical protein